MIDFSSPNLWARLPVPPNELTDTTTNPGYQRLMVAKHYVELRYCSAVVRCGLLIIIIYLLRH